jgi:hypothetical protein
VWPHHHWMAWTTPAQHELVASRHRQPILSKQKRKLPNQRNFLSCATYRPQVDLPFPGHCHLLIIMAFCFNGFNVATEQTHCSFNLGQFRCWGPISATRLPDNLQPILATEHGRMVIIEPHLSGLPRQSVAAMIDWNAKSDVLEILRRGQRCP